MMQCPYDGSELVCVHRAFETRKVGWNTVRYLINKYACPKCGLLVQGEWRVLSETYNP